MASVAITINGMLYDKLNRTQQNVVLIGEASLTDLGLGGGPIYPGEKPPGIWGPPGPWPTPPIHLPPTVGGGPIPVPPDTPNVPPPGSPPVVVPGTHPVNPVTPPEAVMIEYPGIGKVVVPQPLTAEPK